MLSRLSIATKVFRLAVLLLCLTVALACFLLWHVTRIQGEMNVIVQREVPLAASFSDLNEYGLLRRLAFERWFGTLDAPGSIKRLSKRHRPITLNSPSA